jgi:hypothetical protein
MVHTTPHGTPQNGFLMQSCFQDDRAAQLETVSTERQTGMLKGTSNYSSKGNGCLFLRPAEHIEGICSAFLFRALRNHSLWQWSTMARSGTIVPSCFHAAFSRIKTSHHLWWWYLTEKTPTCPRPAKQATVPFQEIELLEVPISVS